mmetsp:Transcript_10325/g.19002  ORF Transcript_10325/g.19002 Transcript_10325/m.19002 type:complete len:771 (+) Transcript_10325:129-2441(+)
MVGVKADTIRRLGQLAANGDLTGVRDILEADVDWLDTHDYRGATPLIRAVESNRVEVVRYLLKKGANVNLSTIDRWTPLHHCVSKDRGFTECLELLLTHPRIKVNVGNSDGNAPLNLCAMNNFEKCAKALLDRGANPNRANNAKWSPTMQACSKSRGYANMIDLLLKNNADVDLTKDDGDTALGLCCLNGFTECARLLIDHGANVNTQKSNLWSPLMHCCGKGRGHSEIVKILLERGANFELLNDDCNSALAICCMNGFSDIAKMLLDKGATVTRQSKGGWGMLHQTVCKGRGTESHFEIARALLDHGIDVNLRNHEHNTALNLAAMNGFLDIAKLLVESGSDVNNQASDGWSPLHCTVGSGRGYGEIAEILVENGADIDARNKQGVTPLGLCAMNDYSDVAAFLVHSGANVNSSSDSGWTALMESVASGRGHRQIATMLIEAGADLDLQNTDGFTALHLAALHNFYKIASLIVSRGANLDLKENDGWTPLHCVCSGDRGYVKIAKLLLKNGCDVNATDNDGWNAVFFCVDWESPKELLALLAASGANLDHRMKAGLTPLLMACEHGSLEKVKHLVELGASLEAPFFDCDLRIECPQSHPLVDFQLEEGRTFCNLCGSNKPPQSWLRSCRGCDYDICKACATQKTPTSFLSPLQMAEGLGYREVAKFLRSVKAPAASKSAALPSSSLILDEVLSKHGTKSEASAMLVELPESPTNRNAGLARASGRRPSAFACCVSTVKSLVSRGSKPSTVVAADRPRRRTLPAAESSTD